MSTSYDFDKVIDRSGSGDLKHCVLQERYGRSDLLPLWVADMDFETPPFITAALRRRLDHSLFGYTVVPEELWTTVIEWIQSHHQWQVERPWLTYIPGIVKGIGMAINVFVKPDEKVIIQPPVYHPFRLTPQGNGRKVVYNPLKEVNGTYEIDFGQLAEIADDKCRLLILSNPHNPAGICWSRETLQHLAHFCHERHIIVISDEIHADMALFGHRHTPFASVSDEAAQVSITFGAPSKTFNIAGIVSSYAIVPVTSMASELAQSVGFSRRRLMSIRLAVEEMLTERITDAYSAAGDIRVRITLMPEWLRISFSDDGAEYFIDKRRDTSMSAKIILKAVSDFHTDYPEGKPVYCMDFLYENEFSIQEFLMKSKEEIEA